MCGVINKHPIMDPKKPVSDHKERNTYFRAHEPVLDKAITKAAKFKSDRENSPTCKNPKPGRKSLIPRLQIDKIPPKKDDQENKNKMRLPKKKLTTTIEITEDYNLALKKLEEKENTIAEYYTKVEALIRRITGEKSVDKFHVKSSQRKAFIKNSLARKMFSDPMVFKKVKYNNISSNNVISEFENCVREISDIWLKTSADLARSFGNLSKEPHLCASHFESEKVKIQKVIRRARSFTLVKTRNVMADARKILLEREKMQKNNKNIISDTTGITNKGVIVKDFEIKNVFEECNTNQTSPKKPQELSSQNLEPKPLTEVKGQAELTVPFDKEIQFNKFPNEKANVGDTMCFFEKAGTGAEELAIWTEDLTKKQELAKRLKSRIFALQNTYNEYSLKCNELQMRVTNFSKKVCWDQILMNKIGTLKEIDYDLSRESEYSVQDADENLQFKMKDLNDELDILNKMNNLLIEQKCLLDHQNQYIDRRKEESIKHEEDRLKCLKDLVKRCETAEKIFNEKQNVINQLRGILNVMIAQKNIADKHISVVENKIEALKKLGE